jgi:hypothetical protein
MERSRAQSGIDSCISLGVENVQGDPVDFDLGESQ